MNMLGYIFCNGKIGSSNIWLNGSTEQTWVNLESSIYGAGHTNVSGTLWSISRPISPKVEHAVLIECLGTNTGVDTSSYLYCDANDQQVTLAKYTQRNNFNTQWVIEKAEPFGKNLQPYTIRSADTTHGHLYLNGITTVGSVNLSKDLTNDSGTRWVLLQLPDWP